MYFQPSKAVVVSVLGFTTIVGYGTTFYLPAVLGGTIAADTGLSLNAVIAGLSLGMLIGGFVAPALGRAVDRHGGRRILSAGSIAFACGLVGLGASSNIPGYFLAWCVIGLGMGAALYEAAFASLGRWYGQAARPLITTVTVFGGFASTICWPLSAYLGAKYGWRSTCFIYAAVHLFIAFPLHAWLLPDAPDDSKLDDGRKTAEAGRRVADSSRRALFILVGISLTLAAVVASAVAVHLLTVLEARGHTAASAVAIGTLLGPAQVAGRLIELAWGRLAHPLWSAFSSAALMALGIALLSFDLLLAAIAVATYAAGAGVSFVVRGTLPLALFGAAGYGSLMGRLALPSLVAQASAPWLAALLLTHRGTDALLGALLLLSIAQMIAVGAMFACTRPKAATTGAD